MGTLGFWELRSAFGVHLGVLTTEQVAFCPFAGFTHGPLFLLPFPGEHPLSTSSTTENSLSHQGIEFQLLLQDVY